MDTFALTEFLSTLSAVGSSVTYVYIAWYLDVVSSRPVGQGLLFPCTRRYWSTTRVMSSIGRCAARALCWCCWLPSLVFADSRDGPCCGLVSSLRQQGWQQHLVHLVVLLLFGAHSCTDVLLRTHLATPPPPFPLPSPSLPPPLPLPSPSLPPPFPLPSPSLPPPFPPPFHLPHRYRALRPLACTHCVTCAPSFWSPHSALPAAVRDTEAAGR